MRLLFTTGAGNPVSANVADVLQGAIGTAVGLPDSSDTYTQYIAQFRDKCARTPAVMNGCPYTTVPAATYSLIANALQAAAVAYQQLYAVVHSCGGSINYVYNATSDTYSFSSISTPASALDSC